MKTMKIRRDFFILCTILLSLVACSKESKDGEWDPMIWKAETTVSQTSDGIYHVSDHGETLVFTCRNYSRPWISNALIDREYLDTDDFHTMTTSWLKIRMTDNKLTVVFEANTTADEKTLQLTVTAGDIFKTFRFLQSANTQSHH